MRAEIRQCGCGRQFTIPTSGKGRNRRKCLHCSPPRVLTEVTSSKSVVIPMASENYPPPDTKPMVFSSDIEDSGSETPQVGPFQQKAEHILTSFPDCDEAKALGALAIAKALDAPDVTGATVGSLVTKWLSIMDMIKSETPSEPDEVDEMASEVQRKLTGV